MDGLDVKARFQRLKVDMSFVAEDVETPGERNKVVELGCDLLQSYLFAVPERGFSRPRW